MIIELDKFNFFYWLEGCARGSHLRQGVWERVVSLIPQMDTEFRDCIWWWCRRDLWDMFNKPYSCGFYNCGREDFNHCMAAFHRNNYAIISWVNPDKKRNEKGCKGKTKCYRYNGVWYVENHFKTYIPEDWVKGVEWVEYADNEAVEISKIDLWKNADYDNK